MHKILNFILSFVFTVLWGGTPLCAEVATVKPIALVSVAPHKAFVEKIAGDTVDVRVIVPPGASPHTFEPTPKQMIEAAKAKLWFRVGESFEKKLSEVFRTYSPAMIMVNMREGVNMICYNHPACCCSVDFEDAHIWLSPKEAKIQARHIAEVLKKMFPQNEALYQENTLKFIEELDRLDTEIAQLLKDSPSRLIVVSHPAYAYFARDYGLEQLSIEIEGKDPTPHQLTELIKRARQANVKKIFIQPQYSNKGANLIAKLLEAEVVTLDPYSEDYFGEMLRTAKEFSVKQ